MPRQYISMGQYVLLMIGFIIGSAALIFVGGAAKQDAWAAVLLGLVEALVLSLSFLVLCTRFPGMGVSRINDAVWGPFIGKFFTLAFIWYTLSLSSIVMTNDNHFIELAILNGIPEGSLGFAETVFISVFVLYGMEVTSRYAQLVVPFLLGFIVLVTSLSLPNFDPNNLRPVLATPMKRLITVSHGLSMFPFGETVAFMAVLPFVAKAKKAIGYSYLGMVLGASILLVITVRNLGVLGPAIGLFAYPSFTMARIINVAGTFTRMELLVAIAYVLFCTIKEVILLFAASVTTMEMLGVKSMKAVVIPFAILVSTLSGTNFASQSHNYLYAERIYPIYALPFQFGLPLLTLVFAMIRGKRLQPLPQQADTPY